MWLVLLMTEQRVFPETDTTKYVLRTKSAPLSASGTHEVVATAVYQSELRFLANAAYGPSWRRVYEIAPRSTANSGK